MSQIKFGRNYILTVTTQTGSAITIQLPFTVEFEIVRDILSGSCNTLHIRIYNLNADTRNQLRYNFYDIGEIRAITLSAGYGQNTSALPRVFTGNITQASSVREGNSWVTTIEALDGGFAFANAKADTIAPFPSGTPQQTVITTMIGSLNQFGISKGAIGSYPGTISRGNSYSGSTTGKLAELTNGGFFIDNGYAHCLGNNEYVGSDNNLVISPASGLLGTPTLQQTIIALDMLFEPQAQIGEQVELQSISALVASFGAGVTSSLNGFYKLISVRHKCVISSVVCGDAVSSLEMFYGAQALTAVAGF